MAQVTLDHVAKRYDNGYEAITDLNIDIADGEFLVLVGPSGCGKSTALRMIAGLETITGGTLAIGGKRVNDVHPKDRDIAFVFQNYALYPHMTVGENIGFALKLAKTPKDAIAQKVAETAKILELDAVLDRKPGQLSGGQRQRVAMGRAIVRQPSVFLMDEPLSNLDAKLRVQMRAEITRIQRRLGVTTVYVTHDQVEAMTMGDRVAVLSKGVLQQVGTPDELYGDPLNLFVGTFIGSPQMNTFLATVRLGERPSLGLRGGQEIQMTDSLRARLPRVTGFDGRPVVVGLRPEHCEDPAFAPPTQTGRLKARLDLREGLGSEVLAHFDLDADPVAASHLHGAGDEALVSTGSASLVGRLDSRSRLSIGAAAEIAFDPDRLYLFDPTTGASLRS
ncbi:MAG: ABC transporter ATP-binding protein [Acidimicrobiia bacterium]